MGNKIDRTARIVDSTVGSTEIREYVTVHDSDIGDECQIYERTSIKKCSVGDTNDINAGCYIENAEIGDHVQIGPNCSIVGVTHELSENGMTFQNDIFERIILHNGVFVGAGAVVGPGVEIGERTVLSAGSTVVDDVGSEKIVLGSPPTQHVVDLHDWMTE